MSGAGFCFSAWIFPRPCPCTLSDHCAIRYPIVSSFCFWKRWLAKMKPQKIRQLCFNCFSSASTPLFASSLQSSLCSEKNKKTKPEERHSVCASWPFSLCPASDETWFTPTRSAESACVHICGTVCTTLINLHCLVSGVSELHVLTLFLVVLRCQFPADINTYLEKPYRDNSAVYGQEMRSWDSSEGELLSTQNKIKCSCQYSNCIQKKINPPFFWRRNPALLWMILYIDVLEKNDSNV